MKKLILLSLLLCLGAKDGCEPPPTLPAPDSTRIPGVGLLKKMLFEGHDYIIVEFSGNESGGAICHSESCFCKKQQRIEK